MNDRAELLSNLRYFNATTLVAVPTLELLTVILLGFVASAEVSSEFDFALVRRE